MLIQNTFNEATRGEILSIKLGDLSSRDKLCWSEKKAHHFTIKSALPSGFSVTAAFWRGTLTGRETQFGVEKSVEVEYPQKLECFYGGLVLISSLLE